MKKLLLLFSFIILLSLASATVSISTSSKVSTNSNFEFNINGNSGLYGVEINIPSGFVIVSDPSNGIITNGVYRTNYAANLKIIMRSPSTASNYQFSGKYTEGNGVNDFQAINLQVNSDSSSAPVCPACPVNSAFSNCINSKKAMTTYSCSAQTNYICESKTITSDCTIENQTINITTTPEKHTGFFQSIINFFKKIWNFLFGWI